MSRNNYLLEQIERAKRFAAAVTTRLIGRDFEKIAADYQNEIDATAAPPGDQELNAQTGILRRESHYRARVRLKGCPNPALMPRWPIALY